MHTIGKVSEITGVSAYTLRYYEKIGLLPLPDRKDGGSREYSDLDIRFIHFISSLKKTGMSLEDITEFVKEGCILEKIEEGIDVSPYVEKRMDILAKHLERMEAQRRELEGIIALTKEKLSIYRSMLEEDRSEFK